MREFSGQVALATRKPMARSAPPIYSGMLRMQRFAGNRAVTAVLANPYTAPIPVIQRCGSVPSEVCPCHDKDTENEFPVTQRQASGNAPVPSGVPGSDGCAATSSQPTGERVRFARFGTAFLTPDEGQKVRDLAHTLGPGERFVIHGFASFEGHPEHAEMNQRLSCARAERVREILRSEGVREDQIAPLQAHGADPTVRADLASQRSVVIDRRPADNPPREPGRPSTPESEHTRICGPDVDTQLTAVLNDIETFYKGLSFPAKYVSCNAITFPLTAAMAWDIHELFLPETGWLRRPPFGGCGMPAGATDVEDPGACSNTVRTGEKCNLAGTVNYSTLGMIIRLCGIYTPEAIGRADITALVYMWKAIEAAMTGHWDDPTPAIAFAHAVYSGGASARPSMENRPTCTGRCTETAVPSFTFRWKPFHDF